MSKPKFIVAQCGHTTTEAYLARQLLGCCAGCAKKLGKDGARQAQETLRKIRRSLSVHCPDCGANMEPLENAEVLLGVFWGTLVTDQARSLTLRAHHRHIHTSYDEARRELELKGFSGKEARNLVRYGET
jgi:hypothetical protein